MLSLRSLGGCGAPLECAEQPRPEAVRHPGDRSGKQPCKAATISKLAPQRRIDEVAVEAAHCVKRGVAALDAEAVVLVRDVRECR